MKKKKRRKRREGSYYILAELGPARAAASTCKQQLLNDFTRSCVGLSTGSGKRGS
jgi:hypothetical protein